MIYLFDMPQSKLRKHLAAKGKTLTWLMRETDLSWATICRAANGRRVRLETALKLSSATGLPPAVFGDVSALGR